MKILIVCGGNSSTGLPFQFHINQSFIYDQIETIKKNHHIEYEVFLIKGKGFWGYVRNIIPYCYTILNSKCDLIHAHYGLAGMLAVLQFFKKVIITYHGCDVNAKNLLRISKFAMKLASYNIFVSAHLAQTANTTHKFSIISCGVDFTIFYPLNKLECRKKMNLAMDEKIILFSSFFDNQVKNYPLAKMSVDLVPDAKLIELSGRTREEVNLLLNACDLVLVTSHRESGPLIIKEAMACNKPAVSVDVGDVAKVTGDIPGYFIASRNPKDIAEKIIQALNFDMPTNGRDRIKSFDSNTIAKRVLEIYNYVLSN